ncbi:GMC family oxidoreductase N-terminal domain-containing protein [Streptomyces sp. NBC_01498]|uniref:GMC family oxidoreductase n=1 Tax=Streptomyces sp. NBC_01498 TaxID=2975870 RepID=UPI002E7B3FE9|nr:GMC family oxidoreductase N-terminal domain-containing protein [Streptomyces sp. NBC_01498]WTL27035.1 GMC family oxidoreductase N-terminal domain-containing protein [Streptomyces sp. NBC_01498]
MAEAVEDFDFVVVGAGTAGSVLAGRLSQDPAVRVLLIEAGQAEGPAAMSVPGAWLSLWGSEVDWGFRTVAQAGLDNREVVYPRGKVLGGSSAINAMMHVRGHPAALDAWGVPGWGSADLLPYYRRSERTRGLDPAYRGTSGPVRPGPVDVPHPASRAAFDAFRDLGFPVSHDINGADPEGITWTELTAPGGVRQSAADAYLTPAAGRPNLTVATGAPVVGLTFSGDRCTGVRHIRGGVVSEARATREVVLSAGAVGSPHLLQLSGVGPADLLREHGIEVVRDLPGVGADLSDHPVGVVTYAADMTPGDSNHIDVFAAVRSSENIPRPDLHLLFIDVPLAPPGLDSGYTMGVGLLSPYSRGSVTLLSADPDAAPAIDPGFLTDQRDADRMIAGLRLARRAGGAKALQSWRDHEVLPGPALESDEELHAFLREAVISYCHTGGTCRMGTDAGAVTDEYLRVKGIEGLRVVDASVMPTLPEANPNATVLAIAEKAADLMTTPAS